MEVRTVRTERSYPKRTVVFAVYFSESEHVEFVRRKLRFRLRKPCLGEFSKR